MSGTETDTNPTSQVKESNGNKSGSPTPDLSSGEEEIVHEEVRELFMAFWSFSENLKKYQFFCVNLLSITT